MIFKTTVLSCVKSITLRCITKAWVSIILVSRFQEGWNILFVTLDTTAWIKPIEVLDSPDLPHHYRISSDIGTVWVLSHHMVSAGKSCRENLLSSITEWQSEYGYALQPNDLLFLVCDHWISRSKTSRELLHWWMGELPDQINEYTEQGITLYTSESQLTQSLDTRFGISPCYIKFGHPLRRSNKQQLVRKYLQLYAVLQW